MPAPARPVHRRRSHSPPSRGRVTHLVSLLAVGPERERRRGPHSQQPAHRSAVPDGQLEGRAAGAHRDLALDPPEPAWTGRRVPRGVDGVREAAAGDQRAPKLSAAGSRAHSASGLALLLVWACPYHIYIDFCLALFALLRLLPDK